jgi:hypothetical protein
MAGKAKRAAERQAEPAAVVDLDLWDVLLGLMEPTNGPEMPERNEKADKASPSHSHEVEGKEVPGTAKVTRRKARQAGCGRAVQP